jgi:hypothetical protein
VDSPLGQNIKTDAVQGFRVEINAIYLPETEKSPAFAMDQSGDDVGKHERGASKYGIELGKSYMVSLPLSGTKRG